MPDADKKRTRFRIALDFLRRLLRRKPAEPPGDPYANVMAPLRRGPKNRSGAAVAEIEDDSYRSFPREHHRLQNPDSVPVISSAAELPRKRAILRSRETCFSAGGPPSDRPMRR